MCVLSNRTCWIAANTKKTHKILKQKRTQKHINTFFVCVFCCFLFAFVFFLWIPHFFFQFAVVATENDIQTQYVPFDGGSTIVPKGEEWNYTKGGMIQLMTLSQ